MPFEIILCICTSSLGKVSPISFSTELNIVGENLVFFRRPCSFFFTTVLGFHVGTENASFFCNVYCIYNCRERKSPKGKDGHFTIFYVNQLQLVKLIQCYCVVFVSFLRVFTFISDSESCVLYQKLII